MGLLVAAILPVVILLFIVYRSDAIEKEPPKLLWKVFVWGALSIISACILGIILESVFGLFLEEDSVLFIALDNFVATALIEEGGKLFATKHVTWKSPEFNYTFDGMVYAIVAALGFACVENIVYVLEEGDIYTAFSRGILAVPGHCVDAVFMGFYYGRARKRQLQGDRKGAAKNLKLALLVPTLTHGFYDFAIYMQTDFFFILFFFFCGIVTAVSLKLFLKARRNDVKIL